MPPTANDVIRAALKKDNRPSREIGELVGIHPVSVRRFKSGKKNLSLMTLEQMAKVLGFKIEAKTKSGK